MLRAPGWRRGRRGGRPGRLAVATDILAGARPALGLRAPKGGEPVLQDLAALTPPLLVCVAFLVALAVFLRHEMGRSRRHRDGGASDDISGNDTIPRAATSQASNHQDDDSGSGHD
jgi:hypothetical protein